MGEKSLQFNHKVIPHRTMLICRLFCFFFFLVNFLFFALAKPFATVKYDGICVVCTTNGIHRIKHINYVIASDRASILNVDDSIVCFRKCSDNDQP